MYASSANTTWSGNDLLRFLSSGSAQWGLGLGYVAGQLDEIQKSALAVKILPCDRCTTEDVSYQLASDVVYEYLQDHPESRHENASILVKRAFEATWATESKKECNHPKFKFP